MIDLDNLPRHPLIEQIVDDLVIRADNDCRDYFRVLTTYYFAKVASCMRAMISAPTEKEDIPVNCFAITLAPSGFGKGKTVGALERGIISGFRERFMADSFPTLADQNLWKLAVEHSAVSGETEDKEKERLDGVYRDSGAYPFTAKSATAASIGQLRSKLLMSSAGAINIQIDEFGNNMTSMGVNEALNVFFELYDMGFTEQTMTKNTKENTRMADIQGTTPANLLLFGEPGKIFDGAATETSFIQLLSSGYARRCLFAWGERDINVKPPTAKQVFDRRVAARQSSTNHVIKTHFSMLADIARHGWILNVPDDVEEIRIEYELLCKKRASEFPTTEGIKRTEMEHRAFKALKLAGALGFVDESTQITLDHLLAAINIVEDSGKALHRMLERDKPHVKLAKFIAEFHGELTHADLHDALPFYHQAPTAQAQMLRNARAWGYKNHVLIKNRFEDAIELFSGEALQETNLEQMIVSYSGHWAYNFETDAAPWSQMERLVLAPNTNWCNHGFEDKHRTDENTIPGFNMVVFDFDNGVTLKTVQELMSDYRYMTYTTKRHTDAVNRFRLILPINYILELDKKDYRSFVEGLAEWLPAPAEMSDDAYKQRSKKWLANDVGTVHYNEGTLVDCLPFIPRTSRHEVYQQGLQGLQSLDNLERWFAPRMAEGNRNNNMIKFALALVDSGMAFSEVETTVFAFNNKLTNGLTEDEIRATILVSVAKKIASGP